MNKVIINGEQIPDEIVDEIYLAIVVRLGYIETGTIHRAKDLERSGQKDKIKVLSLEQMQLILNLEKVLKQLIS